MPKPTPETDVAIVARVTGGDSDSYAQLMERYEAKLLRYVAYLIHNEVAAQDVVQETFIKAYQNLKGFNPKYKFSSWLYRIAHNEAMNTVKKNDLRLLVGKDIADLPDVGYDPHFDEQLDAELAKAEVHRCLAKLVPKYREVVQLTYFENMPYDEVSDVLHVPTSTVGVWLMRAKKQLRHICRNLEHSKGVRR